MKTATNWPQPRDPMAHEPNIIVFFSVFGDCTARWDVEEATVAIPAESMTELVNGGGQ